MVDVPAEFEVNSDGNGLAFDSGQRVKTEEWITDGNGEPRLLMVERTPMLMTMELSAGSYVMPAISPNKG